MKYFSWTAKGDFTGWREHRDRELKENVKEQVRVLRRLREAPRTRPERIGEILHRGGLRI